jgi:N-acetylmuramoyl-L-alanine amidase
VTRIAIVVGHNEAHEGAVRVTDAVTEFDWNSHLADLIAAHDPARVRIFHRTPEGGYSAEIDRVYAEVDAWGADVSVELHFNAAASAAAHGCETLTSGTSGSRALAASVQAQMLRVMGARDRGVKARGRHDRGGRSLWQGRAPAVIVEPYFGSHAPSCAIADEAKDQLAEAIYRGAAGIPVATPRPTPTPAPEDPAGPFVPAPAAHPTVPVGAATDPATALRRIAGIATQALERTP